MVLSATGSALRNHHEIEPISPTVTGSADRCQERGIRPYRSQADGTDCVEEMVGVGSGTYNGTVQQNFAWSTPVVDHPWQKFARQDYKRYPQEIGAEQVQ